MLNEKSPGPNGFSNEYYRAFSSTLTLYFYAPFSTKPMLNGSVLADMLQLTVVTLPKLEKTPDSPANFWTISLLNTGIKLYAKLLVSWILKVLPTLINPDQVWFIKGRQAPDGSRRLLNIISKLECTNSLAIFLSLDAEKAFDRIHLGFVFKTLSKFKFKAISCLPFKLYILTPQQRSLQMACFPNCSTSLMIQDRVAPYPLLSLP